MILRKIIRLLPLFLLIPSFVITSAQDDGLSAVVTVISDDVYLQRSGTVMELQLRKDSVAPLGSGDWIRTEGNGRVFITFPDANRLLLLPNTRYQIRDFRTSESGKLRLEAYLEGIAIQQFTEDVANWEYALTTDSLTVIEPSELFAVWGVPDRLTAAISSQGTLMLLKNGAQDQIPVFQNTGVFVPYNDEAVALDAPLHPSQLLALAIDCSGTVITNGSAGLRIRSGAALDYLILVALEDGKQVRIVGITENGLWYRIPFQTGFGWLYSSLVGANCEDLPHFPNLFGEINETIHLVTQSELELLEPFYGLPVTNPTFYR